MEAFLLPLGMFAFGLALVFTAFALFGEYRSLFLRNPRIIMSTEVFTHLAGLGGLGYIGAVLMIAGAILIAVACVMLVFLIAAVFAGETIGIVRR